MTVFNDISITKVVNGEESSLYIKPPLDIDLPYSGGEARTNAKMEFIMWDGEACVDTSYCLFGNSKGDEICVPRRITSVELIELMMESARKYSRAFHIGYGFDYDVDNILWDVPKYKLAMLNDRGRIRHKFENGITYAINYIPGKSIRITELKRIRDKDGHLREKRGTSIRIDDIVSYFRTRYDKALGKYHIGTPAELASMAIDKERRNEFYWKNIESIRRYFRVELRLGPPLIECIRRAVYGAGYHIGQWYGPGAIAKAMLRKHNMHSYMGKQPDEIRDIALSAFSAGRFERFKIGYYEGTVYVADINSAHPYGISQLPNMANGSWHYIRHPDRRNCLRYRMALWHIRYEIGRKDRVGIVSENKLNDFGLFIDIPFPLFQRRHDGAIYYPMAVDNWYHSPEAMLVVDDPFAEFVEAWIYEDDDTYPWEWVNDDYQLRQALIVEQNPAEYAIKLGLNSGFGSIAQRIGWNVKTREPPHWHSIELAGLITSYTKSLVWRAAIDVGQCGGLVSIDTDSITSTVKPRNLPNGEGNQLGRWKVEEYSGILYLSNGNYWVRDMDGNWLPPKVRGWTKGNVVPTIELGMEALRHGITMQRRTYVGFKRALAQGWDKRGEWLDEEIKYEPNFASKFRPHYPILCPQCADKIPPWETLHSCMINQRPKALMDSERHSLPWLEPDKEPERKLKYMRMINEELQ